MGVLAKAARRRPPTRDEKTRPVERAPDTSFSYIASNWRGRQSSSTSRHGSTSPQTAPTATAVPYAPNPARPDRHHPPNVRWLANDTDRHWPVADRHPTAYQHAPCPGRVCWNLADVPSPLTYHAPLQGTSAAAYLGIRQLHLVAKDAASASRPHLHGRRPSGVRLRHSGVYSFTGAAVGMSMC